MDGAREFGEVKAKVDALAEAFADFRAEMRKGLGEMRTEVTDRLKDHSKRLGTLERWRFLITGGLLVLAFLLGAPAVVKLLAMAVGK